MKLIIRKTGIKATIDTQGYLTGCIIIYLQLFCHIRLPRHILRSGSSLTRLEHHDDIIDLIQALIFEHIPNLVDNPNR